jgi:hypothetical protein
MPSLQILNMLNVCLARDSKACGFEPPHAKLHTIERHDWDCLFADVIDEPGKTKYSLRNFGLELCFARKDDNRFDDARRQKVEQRLNRSDMPEILEDWVLELELSHEHDLSPIDLFRIREDPALVVLVLNDEDPKPRNEDVVNLRCAIVQLEGNVIHQVVVGSTEVLPCSLRKPSLAAILKSVGTVVAKAAAKCEAKRKRKDDVEDIHAFVRPQRWSQAIP